VSNPDPAVVFTIIGVSLSCALALIALALIVARQVLPRLEAWCARQDSRLLSALAMSEDAALPERAKRSARELFFAKLDDRQRRSWRVFRRFDVVTASGRRYSISRYRPFNVRSGDAIFCLQIEGGIPVYDKLLAQKLLLEADEQYFLARANIRTFSRSWDTVVTSARMNRPGGATCDRRDAPVAGS
jgi:hypothetical protein